MISMKIAPCSCTQPFGTAGGADYQDKLYGKGQRAQIVVTSVTKVESRCTVCGNKKS